MTPEEQLIEAVKNRNIEEVKSLLNQGANINAKGMLGKTALHYAFIYYRKIDKMQLLQKHDIYDWDCTPLSCATYSNNSGKDVIKLLLEHSANINNGGREGEPTRTSLYRAIEKKHKEVAIFLRAS